jgi:CubicO group peptidase (beta-lactamase class C family)
VTTRRVLFALTVALIGPGALAQDPAETPAVVTPEGDATATAEVPGGLSDPADLEAFLDGVMAAHMPSRNIPAATVSVVKDGRLFFAKGYGLADREERTPVEADRTLFRIGSTSKLFTWTAVMQLVERGRLDLHADINTYLQSFQIPATFPEPITMEHLLTHTPGFEEGGIGYLILKEEAKVRPLGEVLAEHVPDRVRPPGTWASYSNYGTALAGLIVEEVSGVPFAEYVERNIFDPLSMHRSTFREPLPESLAEGMATGYEWKAGLFEPGFFELISNFGPAGAMSSTATDMASFMIAHLQHGRFGDRRILEEETARLMHRRHFTADPRLPGMAYGFYESEVHGQRIIGHGGDTLFFHTDLALLPEQDVGLFVSYVANGGRARSELVEAFVERYFPGEEPAVPEPRLAADGGADERAGERASEVAGKYRFTRHNWSDLEKVASLASAISVAVGPDDTIITSAIFDDPWHWVEVEPYYYRQIDGGMTLVFREGDDGGITHMTFSSFPFMPAYRIAWYTAPTFNYTVPGLGLLLCVTILVSAFRRRKERKTDPAGARWAVRLAALVGALTLAFFVCVAVIVSVAGDDLFFGFPPALTAALMLPIVTTVLTAGLVYFAALAWKEGYWTWFRRLHYTSFAVLAVGLAWFYWYWNILGVQYG